MIRCDLGRRLHPGVWNPSFEKSKPVFFFSREGFEALVRSSLGWGVQSIRPKHDKYDPILRP